MAPTEPRGQIAALQSPGRRRMKLRMAIASLLLSGMIDSAHAQDSGWHYLIEPYVMFPNMKGETAIGNVPPVGVDEDPQDIFENLQIGAMLYFEAHNDQWAFSSDVLYMDLEADIDTSNIVSGGKAGVSQLGWELAAMRRVAPWFEVGVSAVYNKIDADVRIDFNSVGPITPPSLRGILSKDLIDPTIVARATFPINDKWSFQVRANLGGFGIGSDLMWELQANVGYRPSEKWQLSFGYRVIDIDYDKHE